jgi:hypothetical protein
LLKNCCCACIQLSSQGLFSAMPILRFMMISRA